MKDWKGIIALAVVTVLAVGLIWATTVLTGGGSRQEAKETEQPTPAAGKTEELAVEGYEGIQKAVRKMSGDGQVEGYEVTVSAEGYQGPILMTAYISGSGGRLNRLEMLEQQETENLGGKIAETDFLKQFQDIALPVSLARPGEKSARKSRQTKLAAGNTEKTTDEGMSADEADAAENVEEANANVAGNAGETNANAAGNAGETDMVRTTGQTDGSRTAGQADGAAASGTAGAGEVLKWTGLRDGTYEARAKEYNGGFLDFVVMTVSGGRVTELVWDAVDEDGNSKRILANKGEYVMTEDGPTWSQQADALAREVLSRQSLEFLAPDAAGKVDGISGVSISVAPFVELVRRCLIQAGAEVVSGEGAKPDGETGTGLEGKSDSEQSPEKDNTIEPISDYPAENEAGAESQIDGISGATISSAAVVQGVNRAYEYVQEMAGMAVR